MGQVTEPIVDLLTLMTTLGTLQEGQCLVMGDIGYIVGECARNEQNRFVRELPQAFTSMMDGNYYSGRRFFPMHVVSVTQHYEDGGRGVWPSEKLCWVCGCPINDHAPRTAR